jgi:predicted ester cyclase
VSVEQNKALIRRFIEAIDANDSRAAEIFRVATPGTHEVAMQVAEDDLVVSRVIGRGVHAGELLGIPASNTQIETDGIAIHRVCDGKIVEYWSVVDVANILQQIGVLPGPG